MPRPAIFLRRALVACGVLVVLAAARAATAPPNPYASAAGAPRPSTPAQRLERRFLQLTAANLRFQADASRLALARSGNPEVKDLANALLARHEQAEPELVRLLHARGMALPIASNQHAKVLKQLAKLQGAQFDRLYVEEAVRNPYRADIANFQKVAVEAEDPVIRAWAERQLPVLRVHEAKAGRALPVGAGQPGALRAQRTS